MSNVKLIHTLNDGDLIVENGTICADGGIETAVYLSLFGGNDSGVEWWGNIGETDPDKQYISETQRLLVSLPLTSNNLRRLVNAIKRDLNWLDAEKDITVQVIGLNRIKISVKFSADNTVEFSVNWGANDDCRSEVEVTRFNPTPPTPEPDLEQTLFDNTSLTVQNGAIYDFANDKFYIGSYLGTGTLTQFSHDTNDISNNTTDSLGKDFTAGNDAVYCFTIENDIIYYVDFATGNFLLKRATLNPTNIFLSTIEVDEISLLDPSLPFNTIISVLAVRVHNGKIYISIRGDAGAGTEFAIFEFDVTLNDLTTLSYTGNKYVLDNLNYSTSAIEITSGNELWLVNISGANPVIESYDLDLGNISNTTANGKTLNLNETTDYIDAIVLFGGKLYAKALEPTEIIYQYNTPEV